MNHHYGDIRERIAEDPMWWDENAVPRYCEFSPRVIANIYADECCLLLIECQECGKEYRVAMSYTKGWPPFSTARTISERIVDGEIHYGDPPNACGEYCDAGATMNSIPLRVLEYWKREGVKDWERDAMLEVGVVPDWANDERI